MAKFDNVQGYIRTAVANGTPVQTAASEAEARFNVGVYIDSLSDFNVARLGKTHHWLQVFFTRQGTWTRSAGSFYIKP